MKQRITRRAQRYPVHLEVKELNGQPVSETYLLDISSLGARMESHLGLAPMKLVEFSIVLPGTETETRMEGSVVWMHPVLGSPGRYHMGVKFFKSYWIVDQLGRSGRL
ncbi:MAG: hypothetical protein A3K23_07135 [Desulfobacca sp. RBG_16_58_9]|nr:MAG: hypothetical protein A3K23_07135 [Desulfobacca sp. RBG_16_58_9]